MNSKISIVFPVFNVGEYLEASLNSIIEQDFHDFELIAVNDGSTDNSLEILKKYKERDSRIIIIDQPNIGVSQARFTALKAAKSDYVCFVDSDDIITKDSLQVMYDTIIKNNVDIVECNYCIVHSNPYKKIIMNFPEDMIVSAEKNLDMIFDRKIICSLWAKLFKRELFADAKIVPFKIAEDLCLILQAIILAPRVAVVNHCVYEYIQRPSSTMHTIFNTKQAAIYYYSRIWMKDFIKNNFKTYTNFDHLDEFLLQGYALAICSGGKKHLTKDDYDNCLPIFKRNKYCIPIGQRIVFRTIHIPIINFMMVKLYQMRVKYLKIKN